MLQKEFGETIGFHNRVHKNKSAIVFDVSKRGSFKESTVNFWGISFDSMITHVANHIQKKLWKLRIHGLATFYCRSCNNF